MPRYLDGPEVRFLINDGIFLDTEFFNGEKYEALEPHRMFPISGKDRYIALLDADGKDVAIIRNMQTLPEQERQTVQAALDEYYMMPKILRFIKMSDKFGVWMWTAETDRGVFTFEIRNHLTAVKPLYDGRVLIKDADDNRYEIPDINQLDKRSRKMIMPNL